MHAMRVRGLVIVLMLGAMGNTSLGQASKKPPIPGMVDTKEFSELGLLGMKLRLKESADPAANIVIPRNTLRVYELSDDWFIVPPVPYVERKEIADISLLTPFGETENRPPKAFKIETKTIMGGTTMYMAVARAGGQPKQVRIQITVTDDSPEAYEALSRQKIKQLAPTSNVDVQIISTQTSIIKGFVEQTADVPIIMDLIRGLMTARAIDQVNELGLTGAAQAQALQVNVVNAVRVSGASQIQLKVVIAEVNRTKLRDLGFDWSWAGSAGPPISSILSNVGSLFAPGVTQTTNGLLTSRGDIASSASNLPFSVIGSTYTFSGFLRFVVQSGMGKILAEPTVTVLNGQPAFFNSGGQVPILTVQSAGGGGGGSAITVEYHDFGTNIRCIPSILGNGRIRLDIRPEFSERNDANGIILQGTFVPGFSTRTAETTLELENGQTFVLAGLIQSRVVASKTRLPFVSDIPLVGWAFASKSFRQEDTELMFSVTPYLVDAMDEGVCKLPGREGRIPNAVEWFLGSRFEPPCFTDPYREHYTRHFQDEEEIVPIANRPYDNYGMPPAKAEAPATEMPVKSASMDVPAVMPELDALQPAAAPPVPATGRRHERLSTRRVSSPEGPMTLAPATVRNAGGPAEHVLDTPVDMALEASNLIPAP